MSNNTITKDNNTPQMCRYTTLWNVDVLKQQLKTTHFTKLTTGDNVFIVSVIV